MKKIFVFVCLLFLYVINVNAAATYQIVINYNDVRFRTGPGTNTSIIKSLPQGASYTITDTKKYPDEGGCSDGWYRATIDNKTGYICSSYANIIKIEENTTGKATKECEKTLEAEGFPSDYWGKLCALMDTHKNWSFKALKTNLDWQTAVNKESACGLSYIQTSNSDYIDSSCASAYSSSSSWKPASQKAVAYYMDPRNFLTERSIFQFEYLKYDKTLSSSYISGSSSILGKAHVYTYHKSKGTDLGSVINDAGSQTDVNPIFLSSRMLQELGSTDAEYNLYSGVYEGNNKAYYGFYNFFNYGVSDSCANKNGIAYCGLSYAKNKNWNSPLASIKGASSMLSGSYIAVGQYTNYLQKFNVVPTNISKLYIHQYMTNLAAPSSESSSVYNTYKKLGLLETAFVFYIPVYNNMSKTITNTDSGASKEDKKDENKTQEKTTIDISTIVTSSGYKYTSKYISNINSDTEIKQMISNLEGVAGKGNVKITNSKNVQVADGKLGTGYKVSVTNSKKTETLEVVVKGDTSGDGKVNALDLLQVRKNILEVSKLSGAYLEAADYSNDGKVNALDLLQIRKIILGIK